MSHGPRADGMAHQQIIFPNLQDVHSSHLQRAAEPSVPAPCVCTFEYKLSTNIAKYRSRHWYDVRAPTKSTASSRKHRLPGSSGHGSPSSFSARCYTAAARCTSRAPISGPIEDEAQPRDGLWHGPALSSTADAKPHEPEPSATGRDGESWPATSPRTGPRTERRTSPTEEATKQMVTATLPTPRMAHLRNPICSPSPRRLPVPPSETA